MKLKICGVKTVVEAGALRDSGVDFIGLNFIPSSPRFIDLETAKSIMQVLQGTTAVIIGLFQDQPVELVNEYARELGFAYAQLHGGEPIEYAQAATIPVMKAIAVTPGMTAKTILQYIDQYPADYFVLDRATQGKGDIVDPAIAAEVVAAEPDKICLAGGLNPDNLAEILEKVRPFAIDISSGVRTADEIDMTKVKKCLKVIRSAGPTL